MYIFSQALRHFAVAAFVTTICLGAAHGAPQRSHNWSGFYVGGNLGYHWGKDDITSSANPAGWNNLAAFIDSTYPTALSPTGLMGGAQGGMNWQSSNLVFGIEADANWMGGNADRSFLYTNTLAGHVLINSTKSTFLGTLRPRLGIAVNRILFFGTGGLAIGTLKTNDTLIVPAGNVFTASGTKTRLGWTIGGGLEYALANSWSTKVEYSFVDLGSFDTSIPSCTPCNPGSDIAVHHKYRENIFRAGINYRLSPR